MARKGTSKFEPQIADPDGVSIDAVTGQPMAIPLDAEAPPMEDSGVPAQVAEDAVSDQSPLKGMAALQAMGGTSDYAKMLLDKLNDPEYKKNKLEADRLAKQSILEQQQGLTQNQQALQGLESQGPGTNLMPLYQLSDNLTGSKFSQNYKQPESPQELAMKLYGMRDQLQKQRQGITQEQLARMKALTDFGGLKDLAMIGRIGSREKTIGQREDQITSGAVDKVTNDPILKASIPRVQGLKRIQDQIAKAEAGGFKITPQLLTDINQEYVAALTGRNNFAEGTAQRTSYDNAATQYASILQKLKSKPVNVEAPEILTQIKGQINGLSGDWQKAVDERSKMLQRNYAHVPAAGKAQSKAITDMINTYGTGSEPQEAAPSGPKVGDVLDGHKYLGGNPGDPKSWEEVK